MVAFCRSRNVPWLLVAASSSFACGLVRIQSRYCVSHALIPERSFPDQPGVLLLCSANVSSSWLNDCVESMIPVPLIVVRHGMICEKVMFGFILVAGSRNHVRMSRAARFAYFASPV